MMRKFFVGVVLGLLSVVGMLPKAEPGLILLGNDEIHKLMATPYSNVGYVLGLNSLGSYDFLSTMNYATIDNKVGGTSAKHTFQVPGYFGYKVGFGSNIFTDTGILYDVSVVLHPTLDQAALIFNNPVANITPAQFYNGNVTVGLEGTIVGYGGRQYLNDPTITYTGDRRAGFDVVDFVSGNEFTTVFNRDFNPDYRPFEMGLRPGDSGSGIRDINGDLFGNGVRMSLTNGYNSISTFEIYDRSFYSNVFTTSSVPEPSSFMIFASLMPSFIFYRGRRSALIK